jgi:hypothetical protein
MVHIAEKMPPGIEAPVMVILRDRTGFQPVFHKIAV